MAGRWGNLWESIRHDSVFIPCWVVPTPATPAHSLLRNLSGSHFVWLVYLPGTSSSLLVWFSAAGLCQETLPLGQSRKSHSGHLRPASIYPQAVFGKCNEQYPSDYAWKGSYTLKWAGSPLRFISGPSILHGFSTPSTAQNRSGYPSMYAEYGLRILQRGIHLSKSVSEPVSFLSVHPQGKFLLFLTLLSFLDSAIQYKNMLQA